MKHVAERKAPIFNALTWCAVALPWLAGVIALALSCQRAYTEGRNFVPGLHFFGWLLYFGSIALVTLAGLIIALTTILLSWRNLKATGLLIVAWCVALSSLLVPAAATRCMQHAFDVGRDRAYANVNLPEIHAACTLVRQQFAQERQLRLIDSNEPLYLSMPAAIRTLHPDTVWVYPSAVILQMDGGGVAYHEGIAVIWDASLVALREHTTGMQRLDPTLPIFRYALDGSDRIVQGVTAATTLPS